MARSVVFLVGIAVVVALVLAALAMVGGERGPSPDAPGTFTDGASTGSAAADGSGPGTVAPAASGSGQAAPLGEGTPSQVGADVGDASGDASAPDGSPSGVNSVVLPDSRIVLRYPETFGLASSSETPDACEPGYDFCLYDQRGGSALAAMSVDVRDDLASQAECVLATGGAATGLPAVSGASDHAATRFASVVTERSGAKETVTLRRLRYAGTCYEFVARVVSQGADSAESAAAVLAGIADAVSLPDGRAELWASGR